MYRRGRPPPPPEFSSGGIGRPTRRISRREREKKFLSEEKEREREREGERERESALARIKRNYGNESMDFVQPISGNFSPLNVSAQGGIDFSHEAK